MEYNSPYLADRARNNVQRLTNFKQDVNEECQAISDRIVELRHRIVANIGG